MDRRRFLLTSLAEALSVPLAAGAQQPGRVYRIGALRQGPDPYLPPLADAMRALGWVEGQNLKIEIRHSDSPDQLPALAAELVALRVDLIFTGGTVATQAAKAATKTIPIVFSLGDDPVASGLIASFARPGGNLTGFALGHYDEKLLQILKEAVPRISRVAFPAPAARNPLPQVARLSFEAFLARLKIEAQMLSVEILPIEFHGPEDIGNFFPTAKRQGANCILMPNIVWFRPLLKDLGVAAAKSHLPAIGFDRQFAESGGLLGYGPTSLQNIPRLATQIDKILRGAKPADLPVEQPTKFELVINLKTAKALGLTIPPSLLARADQVIE